MLYPFLRSPSDGPSARREDELPFAPTLCDHLTQLRRDRAASGAVQIAGKGSSTGRAAEEWLPKILERGKFQLDFESSRPYLHETALPPQSSELLATCI